MKELQERIAEITSELSKATKELGKVIDRHADDPTELVYSLRIIGTVLAEAHSNAAMVVQDLGVCIKFAKDESLEIHTQKGERCGSCEDTGLYLHHGGGEFFCSCEAGVAKRKGIEIPPQKTKKREFTCKRCKDTGKAIGSGDIGRERYCDCAIGKAKWGAFVKAHPLRSRPFLSQDKEEIER